MSRKEDLKNGIREWCGVIPPEPTDTQLAEIIKIIDSIPNPTIANWQSTVYKVCTGPYKAQEGLNFSDLNALLALARDEFGNE